MADVELAEVRDFLARYPPFDALPAPALDRLPGQLAVEYFRRGTPLVAPGRHGAGRRGAGAELYVLRSGAVDVLDRDGTLLDRAESGDCVGPMTAPAGTAGLQVIAIEDTLALVVEPDTFRRLCEDHPDFARFFDEQRAARLRPAVAALHVSTSGDAVLRTRVRDLLGREPVTVAERATVRQAAEVMSSAGVSCLLVMDGDRLVGIVTDRDLRNRVLAAGLDPGVPVSDVMTRGPVTAGSDALAFEVLLEMVARNIHHLPVVRDGRPEGVVTATDLMRLERASPVHLAGEIGKQDDVAGVAAASGSLSQVVVSLVAQDASAEEIGRVVTAVGDAVERRLLQLAEARLGPPPVPYCWVTLGSRARLEQGLAADQDHALILDDALAGEDAAYFAALASQVTDGLVRCGYQRCAGEAMATNPRWRGTLGQWRRHFGAWLTEPTPEAVLRAGIFFDMRPVHGHTALFEALSERVLQSTPGAWLFLAHLAKHAAGHETPLGFFRGFVLERHGEHRDTLDLKRGGISAVVELARVHALSIGAPAVHTQQRLAAAVDAGAVGPDRAADLRDAFEFISYLRLRHQAAQVQAGVPVDNRVSPDTLSHFDKRHLRDAFAIIRSAQGALARRYPLHYIS